MVHTFLLIGLFGHLLFVLYILNVRVVQMDNQIGLFFYLTRIHRKFISQFHIHASNLIMYSLTVIKILLDIL